MSDRREQRRLHDGSRSPPHIQEDRRHGHRWTEEKQATNKSLEIPSKSKMSNKTSQNIMMPFPGVSCFKLSGSPWLGLCDETQQPPPTFQLPLPSTIPCNSYTLSLLLEPCPYGSQDSRRCERVVVVNSGVEFVVEPLCRVRCFMCLGS